MITAIVQFQVPGGPSLAQAKALFESTAPRYRGMAGLIRKYYLFDPATATAGGCYLFEDRAGAEAVFNDELRALIQDKYGAAPQIAYFETPVVVDNATEEILA